MNGRIIIDTQAFLDLRGGHPRLSSQAKKCFLDPQNEIFLSIASVWEIQIKVALKKLQLGVPVPELVQSALVSGSVKLLPVELDHIYALGDLPFHHKDPFDRLIMAQAIFEKMSILSADPSLDGYGVERKW